MLLLNVVLRRISLWFALRITTWRRVHGVLVGALPYRGVREELSVERIEDALKVLEAVAPWRVRRLARDVRRLLAFPTGRHQADGTYIHLYRLCLLNPPYIGRADVGPLEVAQLIVHEATHARIRGRGIRMSRKNRQRIEAVCRRAEHHFQGSCERYAQRHEAAGGTGA